MLKLKLSVVISNYNHAKYIAEALEAMLNQSFRPMEVIVIDDASTDNSIEIIEKVIKNDPIVKFIKNDKNMGGIYNINKFLNLVKGDYFYAAAADDKVMPGFFEKSMGLLAQYPQAGLCSALTLCINAQSRNEGVLYVPIIPCKHGFIFPEKALPMLYKHGSWMQGNTVILRKRALIDSGGYFPQLQSFCDGFIYQVIAARYGVCFISKPLAAWRKLANSYSATIAKDSKASLQWISQAKKLMHTTYSDLFPADFVDVWERREVINSSLSRFYNLQSDELEDLRKLTLCQGLADKYFFGFRKLLIKIDYLILKLYLYRRSELFAGQLIIQKIRSFWISILD